MGLALKKPYKFVKSRGELVVHVVNQRGRPQIHPEWPKPIQAVLRLSFNADIDQRPTIHIFYDILRSQLLELRDGDERNLSREDIGCRRTLDFGGQIEEETSVARGDDDDNSGDDNGKTLLGGNDSKKVLGANDTRALLSKMLRSKCSKS